MLPHPHLWPAILAAALGPALIVLAALWLVRRWSALTQRKRIAAVAVLALFGAFYAGNVYAWLIEPKLLVIRRVEIASPNWHGAPLTIAAIGDTHVASPHVDAARMGRIVDRINALRPDLVVLLGDYAGGGAPEAVRSDRERTEILGGVATFAGLRARYGVVGVFGNHDGWFGGVTIERAMEEAGVSALWNRHVVIERGGSPFVVAGLADDDTGKPDFAEALDGADAVDVIVLSHSPDPFADMPEGVALMIAAHSHCGQVTIPLLGRPFVNLRNKRYACGLIVENGRILYVTGGIGTSILPVRFLNPPEIVLITLRSDRPNVLAPPVE